MHDTDAILWPLERDFWLGGADVYRERLTDEALMVFPGLVLTRAETIDAIASGPRWTSVSLDDRRVVPLTADAVALVYRASGSRDGATYSAEVSSVYVRRDGAWKLALHQQSPATPR